MVLSRSIYTKLERWFTEAAVERGSITQEDVHEAVKTQVRTRQADGRTPQIWEILRMEERLGVVQVDEILAELGSSKATEKEATEGLNVLGRVLVEVGYVQVEDIHNALELQAKERAEGTWRLLGQILISMKAIKESELSEALGILSRLRKSTRGV